MALKKALPDKNLFLKKELPNRNWAVKYHFGMGIGLEILDDRAKFLSCNDIKIFKSPIHVGNDIEEPNSCPVMSL